MHGDEALLLQSLLSSLLPSCTTDLRILAKIAFLFFFITGAIFLSVYLGPVTAVLHDIVPKQFRASAFGAYVFFVHLVGEAFAPAIVGRISDYYDLRVGLEFATFFVFFAGVSFLPVALIIAKKSRKEQEKLLEA
jgi:MFS family permease